MNEKRQVRLATYARATAKCPAQRRAADVEGRVCPTRISCEVYVPRPEHGLAVILLSLSKPITRARGDRNAEDVTRRCRGARRGRRTGQPYRANIDGPSEGAESAGTEIVQHNVDNVTEAVQDAPRRCRTGQPYHANIHGCQRTRGARRDGNLPTQCRDSSGGATVERRDCGAPDGAFRGSVRPRLRHFGR